MVAEIYPLQRLPRRFRVFDYLVPDGLDVRRGSFVRISLRGRISLGVVAGTKDTVEAGITAKPLDAVLELSLTPREMDAYESIAAGILQSPSSLLHAAIPLPPKREPKAAPQAFAVSALKIPAADADEVGNSVRFVLDHGVCFVRTTDLRFAAAVIAGVRRMRPGPIRVAAPNVRDAELLHRALGGELVTGDETNNARYAAWSAFRSSKNGLLIGTRIVSLLEHPDGSTLFLVRSGHENLRQPDRNPRYSARSVAREWAARGANVVFLDALPTPDDLHRFQDAVRCPAADPQPEIIEMKGRETWNHWFLSPALLERIQAADGRVLLGFNHKDATKKNSASSVAKALKWLLEDKTVAVCEKGRPPADADVIVATRHYIENVFDPFRPEPFALVADLDADAAFADKSFLATEGALRTAAEWHGVARASRAAFLLQTASPALFQKAFADPVGAVTDDLESRRAYGYPPFGRIALVDGVETPVSDGILPESLRNAPDSVIIDTSAFS